MNKKIDKELIERINSAIVQLSTKGKFYNLHNAQEYVGDSRYKAILSELFISLYRKQFSSRYEWYRFHAFLVSILGALNSNYVQMSIWESNKLPVIPDANKNRKFKEAASTFESVLGVMPYGIAFKLVKKLVMDVFLTGEYDRLVSQCVKRHKDPNYIANKVTNYVCYTFEVNKTEYVKYLQNHTNVKFVKKNV